MRNRNKLTTRFRFAQADKQLYSCELFLYKLYT
jgi:hypothetical protein